jgi:hypothetical protein
MNTLSSSSLQIPVRFVARLEAKRAFVSASWQKEEQKKSGSDFCLDKTVFFASVLLSPPCGLKPLYRLVEALWGHKKIRQGSAENPSR